MEERQKRTRINEYPIGRLATEGYKPHGVPPASGTERDERSEDQSS